jgi:hypothetical protein
LEDLEEEEDTILVEEHITQAYSHLLRYKYIRNPEESTIYRDFPEGESALKRYNEILENVHLVDLTMDDDYLFILNLMLEKLAKTSSKYIWKKMGLESRPD